jgi:two-component system, response regulator
MQDKNDKFVLLVEDNEDDVVLAQMAFQKCQVPDKLEVVYDGQEALDFLFGQGKYVGRDVNQNPAVILLDLKLPYVSGLEVLKQVRLNRKTSRIPVVVLSSTTNMKEIEECEKLGINRYYRKPGDFEKYKRIIEDIRDSFLERDRTQGQTKI